MLKGTRIILKSIEKKEVNGIYNMLCDEELRKYDGSFNILPSKEYILERFSEITSQPYKKYLSIINEKGVLIGYMTVKNARDSCNVYCLGITIGRNFWSRGYGEDSIETILKYLFLSRGAHRVELETVDFNKRAINCYKKCGFVEEGIKRDRYFSEGKYRNLVVMSILYDDYVKII